MTRFRILLTGVVLVMVVAGALALAGPWGSEESAMAAQPPEVSTPASPIAGKDDVVPPPEEGSGSVATASPAPAPGPDPSEVRKLIAAGQCLEARNAIRTLYLAEGTSAQQRNELEAEMPKVFAELYRRGNPVPAEEVRVHSVQAGDSLHKIAKRYQTELGRPIQPGQIKMFNGLSRNLLRLGSKLLIPSGSFSILIRKSTFTLHLLYEGISLRSFPVGLGKDDCTPIGLYQVGRKTPHPTWYPPESSGLKGPIPPEDPRNILGSHWIALEHPVHQGLGIHGTTQPETIGTNSSMGCVRMRNEDVQEVFDAAYAGMEVRIVE